MSWINFKTKPPTLIGQYLIHCTGINVSNVYQIANWDGTYFWALPGNSQLPISVTCGNKVIQSISVDYYASFDPIPSA